jgi:glycosyltransferase involved in cell wall biosynthesis
MELVSVIIPTRNSFSTILSCLESVNNQTYSKTEIIVVDGNSTDKSKEFCEKNNATVFESDWKLLGARYVGFQKSLGQYILLIDSDQILEKNAIENCVKMITRGFDMVCLEEMSFNPETLIERMYEADRRLIHEHVDLHLNPFYGAISPRFYRRTILEKVFEAIPKEILPFTAAREDAIVYFEASKLSNKVTIVPGAIWHQEPKSLGELWHKNRGYGKSARQLARTGYYSSLLSKKIRFRTARGISKNRILSSILLLLKGPAYIRGFYFG